MPRSTIANPLGFFVLRAPLFPFDALAAFGVGLSAPLARPEGQDAALAQDRARSREKLRAFVALPEVREALFVASPSLEAELPMWIEAPETERGVRIEHALVRYVVRMTARATPFGLFAGCALGEVGPRTRLALDERSSWRRHTRFDMEYLTALAERLARDPAIRPALRHRPNSSLYRAAGRLRFAEARHAAPPELSEGRDHREGDRSYHLVAVEPTPYLQATVERSGRGARPGELAAALAAGDEEVSGAEAAAYVEDLIDAQLLQPEILPAVTGPEPVRALIDTLRTAAREGAGEAAASSASALEEARAALEEIDADGLGAAPARYHAVAAGLRALPLEAQLPRLFQVDMVQRSGQLTLGGDVIAEMLHALDRLRRTTAREDGPLHRFRLRFAERYQGRTVPLVEALDDEAGIGFEPAEAPGAEGAPLLETLRFPAVGPKPQPFEKRHAHLLRRLQVAWCAGERELRLDEADWTALEESDPPALPDTFAVHGALCASDEQSAHGDFRFAFEMAIPSALRLMGRFCHADPQLAAAVARAARIEEALRPGCAHAEIVHLPEGRVGNVLLRPVLRDHEIAYLGRSGAPASQQIEVADLELRLEERLVLSSRRLQREVVPHLTSAHDFSGGLPVYRFLCALAADGAPPAFRWNWGPLGAAPFLPRVISGRVVLARARWNLLRGDLEPLADPRQAARYRSAQVLRERFGLPRWVALVEGDNVLPVDLDDGLQVEAFAHLVSRRDRVLLEEMYPPPEGLCAHAPEGRLVHELVVPFVRRGPATAARADQPQRGGAARSFAPGSEWLFVKLYCGASGADRALRALAKPIRAGLANGLFDRWFFLRYADPEQHLRLRFRGDPARLLGELWPALQAGLSTLVAEQTIWRAQLDTYERELERYGGPLAIELAERIFAADSDAALGIVETLEGDQGNEVRWRLALRGLDGLLCDLEFDLASRRAVARAARDSLARELRAGGELTGQIGDRFRRERAALEELWAASPTSEHPLASGLAILEERSRAVAPAAAALRELSIAGRLTQPIEEIARSLMHLWANRILHASPRAQELVLYEMLVRLYGSWLARGDAGSS